MAAGTRQPLRCLRPYLDQAGRSISLGRHSHMLPRGPRGHPQGCSHAAQAAVLLSAGQPLLLPERARQVRACRCAWQELLCLRPAPLASLVSLSRHRPLPESFDVRRVTEMSLTLKIGHNLVTSIGRSGMGRSVLPIASAQSRKRPRLSVRAGPSHGRSPNSQPVR